MDTGGASSGGSVGEFDRNWRDRPEALYNHWSAGRPRNQIQLAFRNHWTLFSGLVDGRRCLEVGSGRGSISSYFADAGFECTLLDSSAEVLSVAGRIFAANGHAARFVHGDANALPFADGSFDVVVSIGLLEHFEDVRTPLAEQIRVLRPGGRLLAYIVPERPDTVQRHWRWLNALLRALAVLAPRKPPPKVGLYRSDLGSPRYVEAIAGLPLAQIEAFGLYPLPMISHSPEFPFSLLPRPAEWVLTRLFEAVLVLRRLALRRHPWICREGFGQAFLLTGIRVAGGR